MVGTIIYARTFGPEFVGSIAIYSAFAAIVARVCEFGLPAYLQREFARDPEEQHTRVMWGQAFTFRVATLLLGEGVMLAYGLFSRGDILEIAILAAAFQLLSFNSVLWSVPLARKETSVISRQITVARLAALVTIITGCLVFQSKYLVLLSFVVNPVVAIAFTYRYLGGLKRIPRLVRLTPTVVRDTFRKVKTLGSASLTTMVYDRATIIVGGLLLAPSILGQYSVSLGLFTNVSVVTQPLFVTAYSDLSTRATVRERYVHFFRNGLKISAVLGLTIAMSILIFGGWVVRLLYGAKFPMSGHIFTILGLAALPTVLSQYLGVSFNSLKKERVTLLVAVAATFISVSSAYLLVVWHGVYGLPITVVATETASATLLAVIFSIQMKRQKVWGS